MLPFAFPIRVCEAIIPRDKLQKTQQYYFGGKRIPVVSNEPRTFVVVGDTGLRSKPSNLGFGLCTEGPLMYGVHQCMKNITEHDIDASEFDGHFQDLSDWPLRTLMNRAVGEDPDVLIHMGDFIYRQGPCPYPNNNNASCSGINLSRRYSFNGSNEEREIMNFVPGSWGDTFWTWWADFFYPSLEALSSVPWIAYVEIMKVALVLEMDGSFTLCRSLPRGRNWWIPLLGLHRASKDFFSGRAISSY